MAQSWWATAGLMLWVAGLALALSLVSLACYEARAAGTGVSGLGCWLSRRSAAVALCAAAGAVAVGAALSVWL